ncbi:Cytoplasmic Fmr1-Interacting Protein 1 [Manis pentadactyla]|nr:Cytoplasmic Fmr1-Interacting Protein 1 [Manis pentadactyla]
MQIWSHTLFNTKLEKAENRLIPNTEKKWGVHHEYGKERSLWPLKNEYQHNCNICFTVLIQPFIAETTYFFSSTASIFLDQSLDSLCKNGQISQESSMHKHC